MPRAKVGGYIYRQELVRAMNANEAARRALRRMVDDQPSPQVLMLLIAKAANALGENLAALRELDVIGRREE